MKRKSDDEKVIIYTDGSSLGNPGPGGFAAILTYKNKEKVVKKGYRLTTNNRMELMAVIEGIKGLKKTNLNVEIVSDSKYVLEPILNGWLNNWEKKGFKKKKNVDLWKEFLKIEKEYTISCQWVKGHQGHYYNEKCDQFAKESALENPTNIDAGYESINQNNLPIFE